MKKFLLRILFFFLPIVLLAYPIDWFISQKLKQSNEFATKEYPVWNALFSGKLRTDIAIYGSSRAWVHVDSEMIERNLGLRTYNFGINAHNFWLEYLRHRILVDHNAPPKLIIQTLDIHSLTKIKNLVNSDQFLPYLLWNPEIKQATKSYNGFSFYDYEIPMVRYYGKASVFKELKSLLQNPEKNIPQKIKGYQGQKALWNGDFEKAQQELGKITIHNDSASVALFENYLIECQNKNIKIVFVYTPEYVEAKQFISNRKEVMDFYYVLSKKYHIPFYDYSNDRISYQKKYFYNASHLTKAGAELFTQDLIHKLKSDPSLNQLFQK